MRRSVRLGRETGGTNLIALGPGVVATVTQGKTATMLTNIRIQNFKSWEGTGRIRLAPITVFLGTPASEARCVRVRLSGAWSTRNNEALQVISAAKWWVTLRVPNGGQRRT